MRRSKTPSPSRRQNREVAGAEQKKLRSESKSIGEGKKNCKQEALVSLTMKSGPIYWF